MFRWIKFNAVGLVGFALQSSVLFVLTHGPRPIGYLPATALAVELAVLNNFLWHQRWTWKDRPTATRKETWRRLLSFHVTNGVLPITGNLAFMALLVGGLHLPVIVANVMSVSALSIFNYLLADRVAFQAK
jgi:dolichol-phosphate mannosyltransferase